MATKISISKAFEAELRERWRTDHGGYLNGVIELIDAAQAAKPGGLAAQAFLHEVMRYRPIVLPAHNGAGRTYAQLAKRLRDYGVTMDQAGALGLWLKAQAWLRDDQLTVEKLTMALPDYLARALKDRPKFKRTNWEDA